MTEPLTPDEKEFADDLIASRQRAEKLEREERERKLFAFSARRTADRAESLRKMSSVTTALRCIEAALNNLPPDLTTKDSVEFKDFEATLARIDARLKNSWPSFEERPVYLPRRPGVVRPPYGYVADEGGTSWRLAGYSHNPA